MASWISKFASHEPSKRHSPGTPSASAEQDRLLAIDGLRGIAALSILAFHLLRSSPMRAELDRALPEPIKFLSDYARSGVFIFFVISGFVIAYSTRRLDGSLSAGGRFALRRQVRLDPPYWVAITAVLIASSLKRLVSGLVYQSYSLRDILLNAVYLHEFFHAKAVLAVAWTLAIEIQFYLFVIVINLVGSRLRALSRQRVDAEVWLVVIATLGSCASAILIGDTRPWMWSYWWLFGVGVIACWQMTGRVAPWTTVVVVGAALLRCMSTELVAGDNDPWRGSWVALATMLLVILMVWTRTLRRSPGRTLLFFGSISYSLYLVHLPVIDALGAGYKITGSSEVGAVVLWVIGAAASIGAAVVLNRLVERPMLRFASTLRR